MVWLWLLNLSENESEKASTCWTREFRRRLDYTLKICLFKTKQNKKLKCRLINTLKIHLDNSPLHNHTHTHTHIHIDPNPDTHVGYMILELCVWWLSICCNCKPNFFQFLNNYNNNKKTKMHAGARASPLVSSLLKCIRTQMISFLLSIFINNILTRRQNFSSIDNKKVGAFVVKVCERWMDGWRERERKRGRI